MAPKKLPETIRSLPEGKAIESLVKEIISVSGDDNIIIKGINGAQITINKNTMNLTSEFIREMLDTLRKLPYELTPFTRIDPDDVIGRQSDLLKLRNLLIQSRKVVVVNGMGGIGKTTLAQAYISHYGKEYQHIAWLSQSLEGYPEKSFMDQNLWQNLGLDFMRADPNDRLRVILNKLRTVPDSPNLLVIDNVNESITNLHAHLPGHPQWHVLVTSREKIEPFKVYSLGFLKPAEALRLFMKHCNCIVSKKAIRVLNATVEYHTLTIEILAKAAQRQHYTLEKIESAIKGDLKANVYVNHKADKIDRVFSYLNSVFVLTTLSENESWLMKNLALLPHDYCPFKTIQILFKQEALSWAEEFADNLEALVDRGWLMKDNQLESYRMHRLISDIVIAQLNPTLSDVDALVRTVTILLAIEQEKDNITTKFHWIPFGIVLAEFFRDKEDGEIATLGNNLALVLKALGGQENLQTARDYLEKALQSNIRNFGEHAPKVAICQSNLALVLKALGGEENLQAARDYLEKALQSNIRNFGEHAPTVAVIQSNLATVLQALGGQENLQAAQDYLEKALQSDVRNYGEHAPTVAVIQSNLATVLQDLGGQANLQAARDYLERVLQSNIRNLGKHAPMVADNRSNLALVLMDLGGQQNLRAARDYLEKALQSNIRNFGQRYTSVVIILWNLFSVCCEMEKLEVATKYLQRLTRFLNRYYQKSIHLRV